MGKRDVHTLVFWSLLFSEFDTRNSYPAAELQKGAACIHQWILPVCGIVYVVTVSVFHGKISVLGETLEAGVQYKANSI